MILEGFDVAVYQTPDAVPWHEVSFGFARVSHGKGADKSAAAHLARMAAAGVERGVYHYLRGDSPGYEQAAFFWDVVCDLGGGSSFALAVDLEDLPAPAQPWSRKVYAARAYDFLKVLRELSGRPCAIYGSPGYLASLLQHAPLDGLLWAAHWGVATPMVPPPWTEATIHQYAVTDNLDRDRFHGSREDFCRVFGILPSPVDVRLGELADRVRAATGRTSAETFVHVDEGPVIKGDL